MKTFGSSATLIAFFLCGAVYAERIVWYVHPDSTLNTIQAGLDSCNDYDVVLVGPGLYIENVIWPNTQGIHLISELGPEMTIIDGDSIDRVLTISADVETTTIIYGFTIQRGYSTYGAGVFLSSGASPAFVNNIIKENVAGGTFVFSRGAGLFCDSACSPIIANNIITSNRSGGLETAGGGIFCRHSSAIIINNDITENIASAGFTAYGGGIYCEHSSIMISDNNITCNIAQAGSEAYGGGICCIDSSSPVIVGNTFYDNEYDDISCLQYSSPTVDSCMMEKGVSLVSYSSPTIRNCSIDSGSICCQFNCSPMIENCSIRYGSMFGIYCAHGSNAIIHSCDIHNNNNVGILCRFASTPIINNCSIYDNISYGVENQDSTVLVNAENNWWGDSTGPYHPDSNPGGLGDTVSDWVDFIPWLYWPGIEDRPTMTPVTQSNFVRATICSGPLIFPKGKTCRVFDITGRVVEPDKIAPGIYFVEISGQIVQKLIKLR